MLFAGAHVRVADRATFEAVLQLAERDNGQARSAASVGREFAPDGWRVGTPDNEQDVHSMPLQISNYVST
jgi:hypothetical protein